MGSGNQFRKDNKDSKSSAEQSKYERWLAEHFPYLDTFEHKKNKALINEILFNKIELSRYTAQLILQQQMKDFKERQSILAQGQEWYSNLEKSNRIATQLNHQQNTQPLQRLTGEKSNVLYGISNNYKSYIELVKTRNGKRKIEMDNIRQEIQKYDIDLGIIRPLLGPRWEECLGAKTKVNKNQIICLQVNGSKIDVPLDEISEKIAKMAGKLATGEIPAGKAKQAQREIIDEYLNEKCGDSYRNLPVKERAMIVETIETEIWKDVVKHPSFDLLQEALTSAIEIENKKEIAKERFVEHEKEYLKDNQEIKSASEELDAVMAMVRNGSATQGAYDDIIKKGERVREILEKQIPLENEVKAEGPAPPRMR